ncbi:hypothetical protein [Aequorivita sinensis]|nr:hypothetical protein [Aequorivita sinensis]
MATITGMAHNVTYMSCGVSRHGQLQTITSIGKSAPDSYRDSK